MTTTASPCRTLIVEDHPATRRALSRLLEILGHNIESAATVAEGLQKLSWNPTCLLLDLMLPDGSGIAILRQIRDDHLAIKVAVTTAAYDPATMMKVNELRPDAIFNKPMDLKDLTQWLETAQ